MHSRLASYGALFLCLLGCGGRGEADDPAPVAAAPGCSVVQVDSNTVLFVCPDGTTATLKSNSCGGKK